MPAVTLFRGPYHVMEYADDEALMFAQRDGRGAPVRELFPESYWVDVQAAMDEVFRAGVIIRLARPLGTLILGSRRDARGRVFGVASYFRLAPAPVAVQRQPTPLEPPLPLGRAG
jgi:hypothetical protein